MYTIHCVPVLLYCQVAFVKCFMETYPCVVPSVLELKMELMLWLQCYIIIILPYWRTVLGVLSKTKLATLVQVSKCPSRLHVQSMHWDQLCTIKILDIGGNSFAQYIVILTFFEALDRTELETTQPLSGHTHTHTHTQNKKTKKKKKKEEVILLLISFFIVFPLFNCCLSLSVAL